MRSPMSFCMRFLPKPSPLAVRGHDAPAPRAKVAPALRDRGGERPFAARGRHDPGRSRTLVSLAQDNNPTKQAREHSENNWSMMLAGLKKFVERQK
jgi:hypothetical protein